MYNSHPPPPHFLFCSAADDFLLICHVFFCFCCSILLNTYRWNRQRQISKTARRGKPRTDPPTDKRFETKVLKVNFLCKKDDFLSVQKHKFLVREEPTSAGRAREIEK